MFDLKKNKFEIKKSTIGGSNSSKVIFFKTYKIYYWGLRFISENY